MRLAIEDWLAFINHPETAFPMAAILAHSTGAGENSLISQLGANNATDALADSWRVVLDVMALLYAKCVPAGSLLSLTDLTRSDLQPVGPSRRLPKLAGGHPTHHLAELM